MTPDQQAILDVIIFIAALGLLWPVLSVSEARRARRMERKLWMQYIDLSMRSGPYISWEQYRQDHLAGHG